MKDQLKTSFIFAVLAFSVIWLSGLVFTLTSNERMDSIAAMALLSIFNPFGLVIGSVSVGLSIRWVIMFVKALARFRWRGLWLLTSLPFALFWPVLWMWTILTCSHTPGGCAF